MSSFFYIPHEKFDHDEIEIIYEGEGPDDLVGYPGYIDVLAIYHDGKEVTEDFSKDEIKSIEKKIESRFFL